MKKISTFGKSPRALCSALRRKVGASVYLSELAGVLVPNPLRSIELLKSRKLCTVKSVVVNGRPRILITFAEVLGSNPRIDRPVPQYPGEKPTRSKAFPKPVKIAWILGQTLKDCRSNRVPKEGVLSFIKLGQQIELIRYVGPVEGGWLVELA